MTTARKDKYCLKRLFPFPLSIARHLLLLLSFSLLTSRKVGCNYIKVGVMVRMGESDVNKAKQGSMTDRKSDRRQCTGRCYVRC